MEEQFSITSHRSWVEEIIWFTFIFPSQRCCRLSWGFRERFTHKSHLVNKFPSEILAGDQSLQDLIKLLCTQNASSLPGSLCCQGTLSRKGDESHGFFLCLTQFQVRKIVLRPTRIQKGWEATMKCSKETTVALLTWSLSEMWTLRTLGPWDTFVAKKLNSFQVSLHWKEEQRCRAIVMSS